MTRHLSSELQRVATKLESDAAATEHGRESLPRSLPGQKRPRQVAWRSLAAVAVVCLVALGVFSLRGRGSSQDVATAGNDETQSTAMGDGLRMTLTVPDISVTANETIRATLEIENLSNSPLSYAVPGCGIPFDAVTIAFGDTSDLEPELAAIRDRLVTQSTEGLSQFHSLDLGDNFCDVIGIATDIPADETVSFEYEYPGPKDSVLPVGSATVMASLEQTAGDGSLIAIAHLNAVVAVAVADEGSRETNSSVSIRGGAVR